MAVAALERRTDAGPTLLAVCLAALVLPLSFSGGAVAAPAIARDLGGDPAALAWITNAFMLTFGSLLMAAGALADEIGRRRVFMAGVALFVAVSAALALAPSVLAIDLLRAVQGVGAAAALAGGGAALAQTCEGAARARAFGWLGTTFGGGLAFGPLLGGALVDRFGWRAVFVAAAATGLAALALAAARMRESRDPDAAGLDRPGAVLFTATLTLATFGLIQAPASGWSHPGVIGLFAGAAAALAAFVHVERRAARPMLDLTLFRYPRFLGVQLLPIATCYAYVVLLVLLPAQFIGVHGLSATAAGLLMIPLSAPMLVTPPIAARLTRRASPGVVSAAGLAAAALGLAWLAALTDAAAPLDRLVLPLLLIGAGVGFPWGLMDGLSVSVVPTSRAGMASGFFGAVRVAGEGIAIAVTAALLTAFVGQALPAEPAAVARSLAAGDLAFAAAQASRPAPELAAAYAHGFRALLLILAAVTLACAAAVLAILRGAPNGRHPGDDE